MSSPIEQLQEAEKLLVLRILNFNTLVLGVEVPNSPTPLPVLTREWLVTALREEAGELSRGGTSLVDQVDALCDSIIFAFGGLIRMGISPEKILDCLHAVMEANFHKKAGNNPNRPGFKGVKDAVKPKGFVGPEARIAAILS